MTNKKILNTLNYILLGVAAYFAAITFKGFFNLFLFRLGYENNIGINDTNCFTIFETYNKTAVDYKIFMFFLFILIFSSLNLFRKRIYVVEKNYISIFIFILLIFFHGSALYYSYSVYADYNIWNEHILFTIMFILSLLFVLIILGLFCLIYFDSKWNTNIKNILLFLLGAFSYDALVDISMFGLEFGNIENPEHFYQAFDYILSTYFSIPFCNPEENPCKDLLREMQSVCKLSRDINKIQPLRGGIWEFRYLINIGLFYYKARHTNKCNESRARYNNCTDFYYGANKKK